MFLSQQGEKAGEILRFLTFRLDFNDFYSLQRAQGAVTGLTSTPPAHLKPRTLLAAAGSNSQVDATNASGSATGVYFPPNGPITPQRSSSPTFAHSQAQPQSSTVNSTFVGSDVPLSLPTPPPQNFTATARLSATTGSSNRVNVGKK